MPTIRTAAGKGAELTPTEADADMKRTAVAKSSDYTLDATHNREFHELGGTVSTVTLPTVSGSFTETDDWFIDLKNTLATNVTIARNSQNIDGAAANFTLEPGGHVRIRMNAGTSAFYTDRMALGAQGYFRRSTGTVEAWAAPYYACFAYRTGTLNVAGTGAYGNLTLDAELFDSGSIHDTSSNTELFAAPSWATKARFTISVNWPTDTSGFRAIKVVTSAAADIGPGLYNVVPPVNGGATLQSYTTPIFPVTGGSSYKVMVAQSSGGVLAIAVLSTYVGVEFFA